MLGRFGRALAVTFAVLLAAPALPAEAGVSPVAPTTVTGVDRDAPEPTAAAAAARKAPRFRFVAPVLAGELVHVVGRVPRSRNARPISFQMRIDGTWARVGRSWADGRFTDARFRVRRSGAIRIHAPRWEGRPAYTSGSRYLRLAKQSGHLTAPSTVLQDQPATITATFRPTRPDRLVNFEMMDPFTGEWQYVGRATQDDKGQARHVFSSPYAVRAYQFRATATATLERPRPWTTDPVTVTVDFPPLPDPCTGDMSLDAGDCEVLSAIRHANLSLRTSWPQGDPCAWQGVTCTGNRVTELRFSGPFSTLTSRIGELARLERLTLRNIELIPESGLAPLPREIGDLPALKSITLSNAHYSTLPDAIGRITTLETLELADNNLQRLPSSIGNLTRLHTLTLDNNRLTSLPAEIGRLTDLHVLDVRENDLTSLPAEIGLLTRLSTLYVGGNELTTIPAEIGQLAQLSRLDVGRNHLTTLPPEIAELTGLTGLFISGNPMESIPSVVWRLTSLERLGLTGLSLDEIPAEVPTLQHLAYLWVSDNDLTTVPVEVASMEHLRYLFLQDNDLSGDISPWAKPMSLGPLRGLQLQGNGCMNAGGDADLEAWLVEHADWNWDQCA